MVERKVHASITQKYQQESIPWTVARCNRLLRSISLRLATIRRLSGDLDSAASDPTKTAKRLTPNERQALSLSCAQSPQGHDPEWMPKNIAETRSNFRTYGGDKRSRHTSSSTTSARSTDSALRTPFLRTLLRPDAGMSPTPPQLQGKLWGDDKKGRASTKVRAEPPNTLSGAYQSLTTGFRNFLINTSPVSPPPRKGARSFFQTCLSRIPQYIEIEQSWREEEDEDEDTDADATGDTYTFLEGLGRGSKTGFEGLRQVVRSHGLDMLTSEVKHWLLPPSIVKELVEICGQYGAIREGQAIATAWSNSGERLSSAKLAMTVEMSLHLDSTGLLFRNLTLGLESNRITKRQLDDNAALWRSMLTALAASGGREQAIRLLQAYLVAPKVVDETPQQSRKYSKSCHTSIQSLAVLVAAIAWIQDRRCNSGTCNSSLAGQLQRLLYTVYHAAQTCTESDVRSFFLGALLSTSSRSVDDQKLTLLSPGKVVDLLKSEERSRRVADMDFILNVAETVHRIDTDMSFEFVSTAVAGLARASQGLSKSSARYLKTLAIDSSRKWAEDKDDRRSYEFAESVDELFRDNDAGLRALQTPASSEPIKYRWEDAMCEWIAATPFPAAARLHIEEAKTADIIEDSGVCMDVTESPSRKRCHSFAELEQDVDLESRDELSMQTPELNRLRDHRLKKARLERSPVSGKENARPGVQVKRDSERRERQIFADALSEDELGF